MCYKADTPYKVNVCVLYPALMTLLISCLHRFLVASHYMYVRPPRTLPVSLPPFPIDRFQLLARRFLFFSLPSSTPNRARDTRPRYDDPSWKCSRRPYPSRSRTDPCLPSASMTQPSRKYYPSSFPLLFCSPLTSAG